MSGYLLFRPALARSLLFETIEVFGVDHVKFIIFADKDARKLIQLDWLTGWNQNVLGEICVLELFNHDINFNLLLVTLFDNHSIWNTFHAILDQELVCVSIFVHIEIASVYLGNNIFKIKQIIEFSGATQLKDDFL